MPNSSLRINILGASFCVSADEEPEYLENLLDQYYMSVERARKLTGVADPLKLAIITGFLLCDDIQKGRENADSAERVFLEINTRIDEALDKRN